MTNKNSKSYSAALWEACNAIRYFERMLVKLYEDIFEAYSRTPLTISSRPYLERALRLVVSSITYARETLKNCKSFAEKSDEGVSSNLD